MRVAEQVSGYALAEYQKTVRLLLRHPLITASYPDEKTLLLVRRWADSLREDLSDQFGYRLELHGSTARLVRVHDGLDETRPAMVRDRVLDRQRYAYLMLILSVLGRAGIQIMLGELAEAVASEAARVEGLGFNQDRYADRRAFVDAVLWLEERGGLRVTDGSATSWANDPDRAEALYDISRDVITAIFRPGRVLQHLDSVAGLLRQTQVTSENAQRRAAGQRARRALIEQPVVYFDEVEASVRNHLRTQAFVEDLERLTGLRVERQAEGMLLVDTAGFSDTRFPGAGAVAQAALLLLGEMADRIVDPDQRKVTRLPTTRTADQQAALVSLVDGGLPHASIFRDAVEPVEAVSDPEESEAEARFAFLPHSFLHTKMKLLMVDYGRAFGEEWRADPIRLQIEAVRYLELFRLVERVDGGVLVLPLAGRYRNVVVKVRKRNSAAPGLFEVGGGR